MKHKLMRGALRVDSRGYDAHHCDSPASATMLSVLLGALPPGAYDAGVQGQRKPRRRPLVPRPHHLPGAFVPVTKDWPLLRREGVRTLSGGPFPSPQLKTGRLVPLAHGEARMRKKKRRSDGKG